MWCAVTGSSVKKCQSGAHTRSPYNLSQTSFSAIAHSTVPIFAFYEHSKQSVRRIKRPEKARSSFLPLPSRSHPP